MKILRNVKNLKILSKYIQTVFDIKKREGFVLVSLLWIVFGLSFVLYTGIYLVKLEMRQSNYFFKDAKLMNVCLAEIEKAKANLISGKTQSFQEQIDDILVSVKIEDEESKLNLNKIDETRTKQFVLFDQETNKQELIDTLLDWLDKDDLIRQYGSESHVKNGALETLDELYLIKGFNVTKEFVFHFKRYVTIFSNGLININTATPEVLLTLPNLRYEIVQKIVNFRLGKDLAEGTRDDGIFKSINEVEFLIGADIYKNISNFITVNSENFKVNIFAKYQKQEKKIEVMIKIIGKTAYIKYWRELE